jgi:Putative type VII ESX secretion system translocon, EccE
MTEPRRYLFGGLESRSPLGAVTPAQVAVMSGSSVVALVVFAARPAATSVLAVIVLLAASAAGSFLPLPSRRLPGRPLVEWLPVLVRFLMREHRWRSTAPGSGSDNAPLPPELADVEVLAVAFHGREVGATKDLLDGTYAAVLSVGVPAFGLLEGTDQERRQEAWGAALGECGHEGSTVMRISWIERTVPSSGDDLGAFLRDARDETVPLEAPAMQSYLELLSGADEAVQRHELLVTVKIDPRRDRELVAAQGGGDEGATALLLAEVQQLADALLRAQLEVRGVLSPGALQRALRTGLDPFAAAHLERLESHNDERDGVDAIGAAPVARDEHWDHVRTDGSVHRVYWISGWPRRPVGAGFLSPLLLQGGRVRTVAMVIEPLRASRAMRDAEAAVVDDDSNRELRSRHGFMTKQRTRRLEESNERRELELSIGHSEVRFAGFVAVHARDGNELREACREVENRAARCHLELRPLYGQQPDALTFVLPLARGLR